MQKVRISLRQSHALTNECQSGPHGTLDALFSMSAESVDLHLT
jgi:hypothetical protein